MKFNEYYRTGELKAAGEVLEINDCTSRGSGRQIKFDDHKSCVECIMGVKYRKSGVWNYYNKNGTIFLTGSYVILDNIGVPSVKDGIWTSFRDNGTPIQLSVFKEGKIIETSIFDENNIMFDFDGEEFAGDIIRLQLK